MKNVLFKLTLLLLLFFISLTIFSYNLSNITVTSTSDDGSTGTLRWAIISANTDPSITQIDFTSGLTGILTLTSNLPQIASDLTIIGSGANNITISGANSFSMFSVAAGKTLTISGFKFIQNKSGTGTIFNAGNSNFIASDIIVTNNNNGIAFFSSNNSTITISNSTFNSNSSYQLFGSDYGSTPTTTSSTLTDYTNRITLSNSTFTNNSGTIFRTERYVKIDNCTFNNNSGQIGNFRGVNRYQILNSNFTNNTSGTLFIFSSWIGSNFQGWANYPLTSYNTLFDGNTFTGNTGTIINPGGNANYNAKTTITNNIFSNNGTNWSGNPAVVSPNTLDNFITSISHSIVNSTVTVTMNRAVFNTNNGTGQLDVNDFQFTLSGGNATLVSTTPTSISSVGNVYTLGINISGTTNGRELLTVIPVANSIFDSNGNQGGFTQRNSSNYLSCIQTSSSSSIKLSNSSTLVTTLSSLSNWTISGGLNQGLFSIANNNVLNFNNAAIYSNNSSNVFLVNVTNGCATRNLTVTISPLCGTWIDQGGDGSSQSNPGSSAYQIKRDYPNSTDGLYWISNANINNGTPFQIYADMTTDGGGWTLIMCNNSNSGWDGTNAILRNENNPSINGLYSIISYADYIKKSASGFQYMLEATTRGNWGGIWTANQAYSFVNTSNNQIDVTLNTTFGNWQYSDSGIEQRLPWYYANGPGYITTSSDAGSEWWGTLIGTYFSPAPWLGCCGNSDPGIIWYWVR